MTAIISTMTSTTVGLSDLFNQRFFTIPNHQRQFAWLKNNCEDLTKDIDAILVSNNESNRISTRFLGYITVNPIEKNKKVSEDYTPYTEHQIIDGQQRITALTVLIACLSQKLLKEKEGTLPKQADTLMKDFLSIDGKEPRLRLQSLPPSLDQDTNEWFWDFINFKDKPPVVPSQRRLLNAKKVFRDWLDKKNAKELGELIMKLRGSIYFVLNSSTSLPEMADIFEGLNNRGKPLSPMEHLKTYFLYVGAKCMPYQSSDQAMDNTSLLSALGDPFSDIDIEMDQASLVSDDTEKDLLDNHWHVASDKYKSLNVNLAYDANPRGVDSIRSTLNLSTALRNSAGNQLPGYCQQFLTASDHGLVKASEYYCDLMRPARPSSFKSYVGIASQKDIDEIRALSQCLVTLRVSKQLAPVLMAFRFKYNYNEYLKLLRLLERVAFWIFAQNGNATRLIQTSIKSAKEIMNNGCKSASILKQFVPLAYGKDAFDEDGVFRRWIIETIFIDYHIAGGGPREEWRPLWYFLFEWNKNYVKETLSVSVIKNHLSKSRFIRIVPTPGKAGIAVSTPFNQLSKAQRELWSRDFSNIIIPPGLCQNKTANEVKEEFNNIQQQDYSNKRELILAHMTFQRSEDESIFIPKLTQNLSADTIEQRMNRRRKALIEWALHRWDIPDNGIINDRYVPPPAGTLIDPPEDQANDDDDDDNWEINSENS